MTPPPDPVAALCVCTHPESAHYLTEYGDGWAPVERCRGCRAALDDIVVEHAYEPATLSRRSEREGCTHRCEEGHFTGDDMAMAEIGTGWPAKWEAALAESEALRKALHALLPPAYEGFSKAVTDPSLVKFVPDWLRAWRRGCELLGLPTDLDTMDSQPTLAALAPTVAASEATEVHGREKAAIEREAGVTADRVYVAYLAPSPATEAERRGGEE